MKDPLLRCFRKSFTAISLYAGVLLERPVLRFLHRKHFQSSPSTHEFNSLNKGTAEQIEGYNASVFKAEFYCYFAAEFYCYFVICGNTPLKSCLRSLHTKRFHTSPSTHEFNSLNEGTAQQSFTAISQYAGILLERPMNKCKAEQSFTAIYLYAGILLERPLNKCNAEQRFTAISLYVGILLERPAEFYNISLYAGILLERPLNKDTAEQSFTAISL
ncbi:hypothetical protein P7K49_040461 [Saguinus oedipus]|uniref:Uncharacterized protein n=1 Tax=Saguinus oedipus TaxID=9490 RepID=A0ABQ9TA63_SAGOE|nr:hypothetical protein P7K49_040461 [Saguinus oedipus]